MQTQHKTQLTQSSIETWKSWDTTNQLTQINNARQTKQLTLETIERRQINSYKTQLTTKTINWNFTNPSSDPRTIQRKLIMCFLRLLSFTNDFCRMRKKDAKYRLVSSLRFFAWMSLTQQIGPTTWRKQKNESPLHGNSNCNAYMTHAAAGHAHRQLLHDDAMPRWS